MDFIDFWEFLSVRVITFFTAMTPIGKLRASIPLALGVYHMNIYETYIISVLGNLIPAAAILWILEPLNENMRDEPINCAIFDAMPKPGCLLKSGEPLLQYYIL